MPLSLYLSLYHLTSLLTPLSQIQSKCAGSYHPIGVRVQAVTPMTQGFDIQRVEDITGVSS